MVDDELPEFMELQMPEVSGFPGEAEVPDEPLLVFDPDVLEVPEPLDDEELLYVVDELELLPVE